MLCLLLHLNDVGCLNSGSVAAFDNMLLSCILMCASERCLCSMTFLPRNLCWKRYLFVRYNFQFHNSRCGLGQQILFLTHNFFSNLFRFRCSRWCIYLYRITIIKLELSTFTFVVIFVSSCVPEVHVLLYYLSGFISFTGKLGFVSIAVVQSIMCKNDRTH